MNVKPNLQLVQHSTFDLHRNSTHLWRYLSRRNSQCGTTGTQCRVLGFPFFVIAWMFNFAAFLHVFLTGTLKVEGVVIGRRGRQSEADGLIHPRPVASHPVRAKFFLKTTGHN